MHLRKTKTNNGRIYLAIVDSFYDTINEQI